MIEGAHGAQSEPSLRGSEEWGKIDSRGCRARVRVFSDSIDDGLFFSNFWAFFFDGINAQS